MVCEWLKDEDVVAVECIVNKSLAIIHPTLCKASKCAVRKMKGDSSYKDSPGVQAWPSFFSSLSVIANRLTPSHRDANGSFGTTDFLLSAGTHSNVTFRADDIRATFDYSPGSMVAICGRLLRHSVEAWDGEDRVCVAHTVREETLFRYGLDEPGYNSIHAYLEDFSGQERYLIKSAKLPHLPCPEDKLSQEK